MKRGIGLIVVLILSIAHFGLLRAVDEARRLQPSQQIRSYLPSPPLARIAALEFDGAAADFYFLKGLVFIGSTNERTERPRVRPEEWVWLYELLQVVTALDPRFQDTYHFGNAFLPWEGYAVEANALLDKAIEYRDQEWVFPYYAGFNSFYFLKDKGQGSAYLMLAASRPEAPPLLSNLAARLAYEEKLTAVAVNFLRQQLQGLSEIDPGYTVLSERLQALEGVYAIEQAVDAYRAALGRNPASIEDLLKSGYLKAVPEDPYGGRYYLAGGKVISSSELGKKVGTE